MSRPPPPKSRADKAANRNAAGAQSAAATAPVSNDIVPGRLTEAEWLRLVVEDDDTSFLGSIVDELMDKTLAKCYEKYIWNQLVPYTVDHAKNSILQIIEWHFLSRDVGEKDIANDTGWKEDSEPEAGVIDSWAQGSVPVVVRPQSSLAPSVSVISESVPEPSHLSLHPVEDSIGFDSEPATTVIDQRTEVVDASKETVAVKTKTLVKDKKAAVPENDFGQDSTDFVKKRKRRVYKRHTGRLPPLPSTVEAVEDGKNETEKQQQDDSLKVGMHLSPSQKSLIKSQAGRPPGNREVTFDERGNVIGVMKLNVHTLPTHKVRVQYHVIDPIETANQKLPGIRFHHNQKGNKSAAKSIDTKTINSTTRKSEVSGSYKIRDLALAVQQFPPGVDTHVRSQKGSKASVREKKVRGARIDPLPPLLIEAIEASPGVVIQEGEYVKKGPAEVYPNNVSRALAKTSAGPMLRMVGDRVFRSQMRPIFDPSDVVEVDSKKQSVYAVSAGLHRTLEQTAES